MIKRQLYNLNGELTHATMLPSLPSSWCWASLEDLIQNFDGRRIPVKSDDRDKRPGPFPYYGASGVIDDIDDFIFDGDYLLIAEDGANLLSRSTPIAFSASGKFWVNNHAHIVQMLGGIPLAYLKWYLNGTNLQFFVTGTAQPKLNQVNLNRIPVPVAPVSEQCLIIAKIEELFSDLDAGVAALKRAKANLKRYRAAVLKAAVEGKLTEEWRAKHPAKESASALLARILKERRQKWESDQLAKFAAAEKEPPKNWREKYVEPTSPVTTDLPELPDGWCWAKFDQILTYLRNGYFQSPSGADTGTPILRINAVRPMKVDLEETRFLTKIDGSTDGYYIENGDLLFTRYNGSVDLLGVAGMVRGCTTKVLHPDKLIRVKLALDEPLPSFAEVAVNVGVSRRHMAGRARTTAGQTGISGPDVREMPIPLPPLAEQSCIIVEVAEKLSQIDAAETQIEHGLLRAARLRQSILKQAFEGKLVAQDTKDEPASVLLERLRASPSTHEGNGKTAPRARIRNAKST
jgi:type I restriction enzyme S subunit